MTDPVNTDALRAVASTLHSKAFHLMNAAADEVDRLRAYEAYNEHSAEWWEAQVESLRSLIENAPHDYNCRSNYDIGKCTCWKADAL